MCTHMSCSVVHIGNESETTQFGTLQNVHIYATKLMLGIYRVDQKTGHRLMTIIPSNVNQFKNCCYIV